MPLTFRNPVLNVGTLNNIALTFSMFNPFPFNKIRKSHTHDTSYNYWGLISPIQ